MPFDPIPSRARFEELSVRVAAPGADVGRALGLAVTATGEVPSGVPLDRAALTEWGFRGAVGETLILPREGGAVIATGVGDEPSEATLRDAAAAFARAAGRDDVLTTDLAGPASPRESAAQAVVEGILLGRYRYDALKSDPSDGPRPGDRAAGRRRVADDARRGADRGVVIARAASLSRDLASTPAGHLTAPDLADVAVWLAGEHGLDIEVFDEEALIEMGCGGLLGVNAGSVVEPRMIVIRYVPADRAHRPPRLRRQGHHLRLRRHQPQAVQRDARGHEDGHERRGRGARGDDGARGPRGPGRGQRLPGLYGQHAVGLRDEAGRRPDQPRAAGPSRWSTPTPRDAWSWPTRSRWPTRTGSTRSSTSRR